MYHILGKIIYWGKTHFLHKSRAMTLLFLNDISLFAIPNHSSPISTPLQSLKKIGKKTPKVRAQKRSADGQSNVRRVSHNTPPSFVWRGIIFRKGVLCYLEIQQTIKGWKQQARFDWSSSWEKMQQPSRPLAPAQFCFPIPKRKSPPPPHPPPKKKKIK